MRRIWGILFVVLLAIAGGLFYLLIKSGPRLSPEAQVDAEQADLSSYFWADVPEGPEPAADAVVFEMSYRGLSGRDSDLRYNAFWGFGKPSEVRRPFLEAAEKAAAGKLESVHNDAFRGAQWSAVEFKGDRPVAFYFDLNADGELAENERIEPLERSDRDGRVEFVTPDFIMTGPGGAKLPFRVLLQVNSARSIMWSPSCVLEGTSKIGGEEASLVLYTNGFQGLFTEFGRSDYTLKGQTHSSFTREVLSSLISYGGQFYRLRFLQHPEKRGTIRAVMERDTTATGMLTIRLAGGEDIKAHLSRASFSGAADDTIRFRMSGGDHTVLPEGEYKLTSGYVTYGLEHTDERQVHLTTGPLLKIAAGETCTVELGGPRMIVSALEQRDRYRSNAEDKFSYERGTVVFLSPRVEGAAGEKYGRFTTRASNRSINIEPTFEILDFVGKRVASGKMEYG